MSITEVIIKDLSNIIEEFKDVPYEGYMSNRSKDILSVSYLYLSVQLEKCMMSNLHGLVTTQKNLRCLVATKNIK